MANAGGLSLLLLGADQSGKSTLVDSLVQGAAAANSGADSEPASNKHTSILKGLREHLGKGKEDFDKSSTSIRSSTCCFNIVDASGHKLFVQDLLLGGASADVALLVVDAVHGCFERGIARSGLTKDHASLAFDLGIKKLVIAVSKMDDDSVRFSEQRFQDICEVTSKHLERVGYTTQRVPFVPVSGLQGHNVVGKKEEMSWYTGPTLLETLDHVGKAPVMCLSRRPVRLPIQEVHSIRTRDAVGTVITGCVETGTLRLHQSISVAPGDRSATVMNMEVGGEVVDQVPPGKFATLSLGDKLSSTDIKSGEVISDATEDAARDCVSFTALLSALSHPAPIRPAMKINVNCHNADVPCVLEEFLLRMDPATGKTLEASPSQLDFGDAALVRLKPLEPLCIEAFNEYKVLGQFALRGTYGVTLAIGIIKEVLKRRPPPAQITEE